MNVYDFDNTIYDGESVLDFYLYCLRRHPGILKYIPHILVSWAKYKALLLSREKLMSLAEKYAAEFFVKVKNVESLVSGFWDGHEQKIKKFYLENRIDDDVVISASVSFLLRDICGRLGIKNLICSDIDTVTGKVGALCFRQSKPDFFREKFPGAKIDSFYSDSMNDAPMMLLAERSYLVKGDKIIPVDGSRLKK